MYFGAHVSIKPSLDHTPVNAASLGCETFQFFSQSPRGGKRVLPDEKKVNNFKNNFKKYKLHSAYIHAPYFINLASKNNRIFYGSISAIRKDLEIASLLGVNGVVTHIGSAKDFILSNSQAQKNLQRLPQPAIARVKEALGKILTTYKGPAELILEIAAGAGNIIGDNLTELGLFMIKGVGGICFDTAHAFESGIKLTTKEDIKDLLAKLDRIFGLDKLKVIHLNDSLTSYNSKVDRHAHLGKGKIGLETFTYLVNQPQLKEKDFILETPTIKGMVKEIKWLKKVRNLSLT